MNLQQRELFRQIVSRVETHTCSMPEAMEVLVHITAAMGRSQDVSAEELGNLVSVAHKMGAVMALEPREKS